MNTSRSDISLALFQTARELERTFCSAGVVAAVSPNDEGRFDVGIVGGASIDRFAELVPGNPSAFALGRALGLWDVEEIWWCSLELTFPPGSNSPRLFAWISIPNDDAVELAVNVSYTRVLSDDERATMVAERKLRRRNMEMASDNLAGRILVACESEDIPIGSMGLVGEGSVDELLVWGAEAAERLVRMVLSADPSADQRMSLGLLPSTAWGHGALGSGDECDSGHPFRYCIQVSSPDFGAIVLDC